MSTIGTIKVRDGFIEVTLEGRVKKDLPDAIPILRQVLSICDEHRCYAILINATQCDYEPYLSILAEYELTRFFASITNHSTKWALLVPETVTHNFLPFEMAGRSRGITIQVFQDREPAVVWLVGS